MKKQKTTSFIKHRMPARNLGTIVHKSISKKDPKQDRRINNVVLKKYIEE